MSTEDGSIRVNEECRQKKVTQRPDYEADYVVGEPGIYQMTLTAITRNGTYTIEDWFEVRGDEGDRGDRGGFFDIERETATRIYPVHEYPVTIRVTPEDDFKGVVREYVPVSFKISNQSPSNEKTARESGDFGGDSTPDEDTDSDCHPGTNSTLYDVKNFVKCSEKVQAGDVGGGGSRTPDTEVTIPVSSPEHPQTNTQPAQSLYHDTISWTVDWKAGQTYELSYIYKAPEVSPQFYLLGELEFWGDREDKGNRGEVVFREARQWQVAVDVTGTYTTAGSFTFDSLLWRRSTYLCKLKTQISNLPEGPRQGGAYGAGKTTAQAMFEI